MVNGPLIFTSFRCDAQTVGIVLRPSVHVWIHGASDASTTGPIKPIHIAYDVYGGTFAYFYFVPEFVLEVPCNASLYYDNHPGTRG